MSKGKPGLVLVATARFKRCWKKLSDSSDSERLEKALRLFAENPFHSSLKTEKLKGQRGNVWYSRFSRDGRFFYTWEGNIVTLLAAGPHDLLEKM